MRLSFDQVTLQWTDDNYTVNSLYAIGETPGGPALSGNVTGIFTGPSNDIGFVGGFSVESEQGNEAYGVFQMEEGEPELPPPPG